MPPSQSSTVPVAHRSQRIQDLENGGEFERGLMVTMPCCGFQFGAEFEDVVPGEPMRCYEPPRWTCPQCEQRFTIGALGWLEEVLP